MFVYKYGLLLFNRNTLSACTHTQQMFFWPFPHQRRHSEVFVLEYCCPQSCRPLPESALPERNRRKEKKKINHDLLTEKIGEHCRKGECLTVEKYSSTEKRQQQWNRPVLGLLAMQLKVYWLLTYTMLCLMTRLYLNVWEIWVTALRDWRTHTSTLQTEPLVLGAPAVNLMV